MKRINGCYRALAGLLVTLSLTFIGFTASAQVPAAYYKQNCLSCHTIGDGRLTGPDLKNVQER